MNKLGQNDDLCSYDFSFTDNVGTHVSMSFRAEPEWDLHVVFQQFRKFLIASGHDVENDIGELNFDEGSYEDDDNYSDEIHAMTQAQSADKFSMDHFPNNGWPFGGLTTQPLPTITPIDLSSLSFSGWSGVNEFPTMAPLQSMDLKSLTSADIAAWSMPMPGTAGSAQYKWPDKDAD